MSTSNNSPLVVLDSTEFVPHYNLDSRNLRVLLDAQTRDMFKVVVPHSVWLEVARGFKRRAIDAGDELDQLIRDRKPLLPPQPNTLALAHKHAQDFAERFAQWRRRNNITTQEVPDVRHTEVIERASMGLRPFKAKGKGDDAGYRDFINFMSALHAAQAYPSTTLHFVSQDASAFGSTEEEHTLHPDLEAKARDILESICKVKYWNGLTSFIESQVTPYLEAADRVIQLLRDSKSDERARFEHNIYLNLDQYYDGGSIKSGIQVRGFDVTDTFGEGVDEVSVDDIDARYLSDESVVVTGISYFKLNFAGEVDEIAANSKKIPFFYRDGRFMVAATADARCVFSITTDKDLEKFDLIEVDSLEINTDSTDVF